MVPTAEGEASKVKVKVRMNGHGIFRVSTASLVEKLPPEPEPEAAPADGDKQQAMDVTTAGEAEKQATDGTTPAADGQSQEVRFDGLCAFGVDVVVVVVVGGGFCYCCILWTSSVLKPVFEIKRNWWSPKAKAGVRGSSPGKISNLRWLNP